MKKFTTLAAFLLLLTQLASADLIVSVNEYGEISEEGMEITLTEGEEDPFSGEVLMNLQGNLLCSAPLTITITRSTTGLVDEFCCADQCALGNGELEEVRNYEPGMSSWYIHYTPADNSDETVTYLFSDGTDSRTLTVHFVYGTQDIESTAAESHNQGVYTVSGTRIQNKQDILSLPAGTYITPSKKIIKTK